MLQRCYTDRLSRQSDRFSPAPILFWNFQVSSVITAFDLKFDFLFSIVCFSIGLVGGEVDNCLTKYLNISVSAFEKSGHKRRWMLVLMLVSSNPLSLFKLKPLWGLCWEGTQKIWNCTNCWASKPRPNLFNKSLNDVTQGSPYHSSRLERDLSQEGEKKQENPRTFCRFRSQYWRVLFFYFLLLVFLFFLSALSLALSLPFKLALMNQT